VSLAAENAAAADDEQLLRRFHFALEQMRTISGRSLWPVVRLGHVHQDAALSRCGAMPRLRQVQQKGERAIGRRSAFSVVRAGPLTGEIRAAPGKLFFF
jgi:hypothetical protein